MLALLFIATLPTDGVQRSMLGGATRGILETMTVPVLMSH